MALEVCKNMQVLLAIEKSEKPEKKEAKPIEPMLQTLQNYCSELDFKMTPKEVKEKLGGNTAIYY